MQRVYASSLVYSMMLTLVYGVGQLNLDFMKVFSNVLFPATAIAASLASFLILKRYVGHNPKPPFSAAWTSFSSGIIMWFLGELTWAIYVLYLVMEPFPSLADAFYLCGYVFLFLALFLILRLFRPSFKSKMIGTTIAVTGALSVAVSYLLLIPILASGEDVFTTALSASYPILDIILFTLAFAMLSIVLEGTVGKAWFFLTVGIILNVVADLFFTFGELQGFYYEGHPFELFWLWGYIAFLLGFYIHWREL